jgi:hypothetical protein
MNLWWWIGIGVGAGVVAVVLARRAVSEPDGGSYPPLTSAKEEDREYLARVVILEAASAVPSDETAAIMQVALNRVRRTGATVRQVVTSVGGSGITAWNVDPDFAARLQRPAGGERSPVDSSAYPEAYVQAGQVLRGEWENLIGGRRHFLHDRGYTTLPSWAVSQSEGGRAEFEPLRVGRALFA